MQYDHIINLEKTFDKIYLFTLKFLKKTKRNIPT